MVGKGREGKGRVGLFVWFVLLGDWLVCLVGWFGLVCWLVWLIWLGGLLLGDAQLFF